MNTLGENTSKMINDLYSSGYILHNFDTLRTPFISNNTVQFHDSDANFKEINFHLKPC